MVTWADVQINVQIRIIVVQIIKNPLYYTYIAPCTRRSRFLCGPLIHPWHALKVAPSNSAWSSLTGPLVLENRLMHGCSHQSSFNQITSWKESNEYSITTMHSIACFVCTQSIFDGSKGVFTNVLWWALSSQGRVCISKWSFGKSKLLLYSAQSHWFSSRPFLNNDEGQVVVFCHTNFQR